MADLVTHVLSAQWLAMARRQARPDLALVAGVMLPDLVANVPILVMRVVKSQVPLSTPAWLPDALSSFHSPVLYALLCGWLCALAPKSKMKGVFIGLWVGGLLHIGVDLLQNHVVPGAYYPGFPFLRQPWEWGFLHTESSLTALPILAAVTFVAARSGWPGRPDAKASST